MRPVATALALTMSLAPPRHAPPRACAPLTSLAYGAGTSLHVDAMGVRAVRRMHALPPAPPGAVRVVFVSDTHQQFDQLQLPDGDVLCHTGDLTFCSRGGLTALRQFNAQLATLPHRHKVVIAGNHDRRVEQMARREVRELLSAAHYLEDSGVRLCGLHFWGSPFSAKRRRRSSNTAFQYGEERQRQVWRYVPNDVDVLLTHGAASGSAPLAAAIERIQPYVHAHGHDHALHGATLQWAEPTGFSNALPRHLLHRPPRPGGRAPASLTERPCNDAPGARIMGRRPTRPQLVTVNAAICNKRYEPVQLPIVVDLPTAPDRAQSRRNEGRALGRRPASHAHPKR